MRGTTRPYLDQRPQPPREALLIDEARKRHGLTHRDAADRAGLSEPGWHQIVKGYESRRGRYRAVQAKSETLARIALALGITPEQLTEAGREDAAHDLRLITPTPEPKPVYAPPADAVYAILASLPPEAQAEVVRRLAKENPGVIPKSQDRHAS